MVLSFIPVPGAVNSGVVGFYHTYNDVVCHSQDSELFVSRNDQSTSISVGSVVKGIRSLFRDGTVIILVTSNARTVHAYRLIVHGTGGKLSLENLATTTPLPPNQYATVCMGHLLVKEHRSPSITTITNPDGSVEYPFEIGGICEVKKRYGGTINAFVHAASHNTSRACLAIMDLEGADRTCLYIASDSDGAFLDANPIYTFPCQIKRGTVVHLDSFVDIAIFSVNSTVTVVNLATRMVLCQQDFIAQIDKDSENGVIGVLNRDTCWMRFFGNKIHSFMVPR